MAEITLTEIRAAAERLARAHQASTACALLMQEEIRAAIEPIYARHEGAMDQAAAEEAQAYAELMALLAAAPQLFVKPRSLVVDGVRCGYRKEADSLDWDDDAVLIARIRALTPDLADLCIRTHESVVVDAIEKLDGDILRRLGVRRISGADQAFISIGDSDIDKIAKTLLADALRRQGEEEKPARKKGKAKAAAAA